MLMPIGRPLRTVGRIARSCAISEVTEISEVSRGGIFGFHIGKERARPERVSFHSGLEQITDSMEKPVNLVGALG
jgi:hypothetical protein